jgi:hypothetical protein
MAQTWNAGAVTFTGWKLNVTDTASAAASLLLDLQKGGVTQAFVDKSANSRVASGGAFILTQNGAAINGNRSGLFTDTGSGGTIYLSQGINLGPSGSDVGGATDVFIRRAAAAALQFGAADAAAPVAQTTQVQSVVAGTTNTAGVNWTLKGSLSTGSGTSGDIILQTGGTGAGSTAQNTATSALTVKGATQAVLAVSPTGGLGYGTGAGGTVTQITSRTTGVTLNKVTGAITLVSAAGSASFQTFTVTNSAVAATDVPKVCQKSGTDKYIIHVTAVAAGSFDITFATTGGTTTETPVFNFVVVKGVTA